MSLNNLRVRNYTVVRESSQSCFRWRPVVHPQWLSALRLAWPPVPVLLTMHSVACVGGLSVGGLRVCGGE